MLRLHPARLFGSRGTCGPMAWSVLIAQLLFPNIC